MTMRSLYLCATVEPGIIPKIRSKNVSYQKQYKVQYVEAEDREIGTKDLTPVQAYFSLRNFKLAEN